MKPQPHYSKLRVLFLLLEFPFWRRARHWSYTGQLGVEDGLRANGVHCVTVTTPWLSQIRKIVGNEKFDQVWIDIVHPLDESCFDWLASVAPVRIGRLCESLEYSPDEIEIWPSLKTRKQEVEKRLPYFTHVLACDEKDSDDLNLAGKPSMWWPQAVPAAFVSDHSPRPINTYGVFYGMRYGPRKAWLQSDALKNLVVTPRPPESATLYPFLFNALHLPFIGPLAGLWPSKRRVVEAYVSSLRDIRKGVFTRFIGAMQHAAAIVNLPHVVKTYAGRVVEGMAAGRPVISWEIPNRPRNRQLFEHGKEILLYSKNDPEQLAEHIRTIISDEPYAQRLAAAARRKMLARHTSEIRVSQILNWVETGQEPQHG